MRQPSCLGRIVVACLGLILFCAGAFPQMVRADQVEMINGDRYVGRVISLANGTLVLQNENLGTIKLPRAGIASIALDSAPSRPGTNAARVSSAAVRSNRVAQAAGRVTTNSAPQLASTIRELGTNSSVVQQVQQQLLAGAGPEAQGKFNELLSGLMSGKIGVSELRTEAQNTLAQARSARKEMGEDGASLDSYLAILEGFLKETEPASQPTNSPVGTQPASQPPKAGAEE